MDKNLTNNFQVHMDQSSKLAKNTLKRNIKGGSAPSIIKLTICKFSIIKTAWYLNHNRQIGQQTAKYSINLHLNIYGKLIYNKSSFQFSEDGVLNKWC